MFYRNNKKRSNLFFLTFFVLIVTIFFWINGNHYRISDRYLEKYFIENKKNNQKAKVSTKILLNLEIAVILFFVITIVFLLICIFFIFKNKKDILTSFYSHLMSDDQCRYYNRLAKMCSFDNLNMVGVSPLFTNFSDNVVKGLVATSEYLDYFKFQKEKEKKKRKKKYRNKKLYYFYYQKNDEKNLGNFCQAEVVINEQEYPKDILSYFFLDSDDNGISKIMNENQKDTDYRDFIKIKTKIDEIENFNFVDKIFAQMKLYYNNDINLIPSLSAIRKMIFFNFFLDPSQRTKEENGAVCCFGLYTKVNEDISKDKAVEYYAKVLQVISNNLTVLNDINAGNNNDINDINDKKKLVDDEPFNTLFSKLNVRTVSNDKVYYLPYSTFIVNLLGLYKKIIFAPSNQIVSIHNESAAEVNKIDANDVLLTKQFFGSLVYNVLHNYLLFLKRLIFLEKFDFFEKSKENKKNFPPQFLENIKNTNDVEQRIRKKIDSYIFQNEDEDGQ